jgi:hypothetical protein
LGAIFLAGKEEGKGFQPLGHKDQFYATITYKF